MNTEQPKIKRKGISKKARFDILTRDGFTCRYCGATGVDVLLEVDHLIPVSKGGSNEPSNLITSCRGCNRGKYTTRIDQAPPADHAKRKAELKLQIATARTETRAVKARERLRQDIVNYWCKARGVDSCDGPTIDFIFRYSEQHGMKVMLECIDLAVSKFKTWTHDITLGRYISGIIRKMKADGTL